MSGTEHSEGVPVESIKYDEYEYKVACKTCGVVESVTLSREDAKGPNPIMDDPAKVHYERTGHTVSRLNYTTAPADVREMLDAGEPEELDWGRIGEWLSGIPSSFEGGDGGNNRAQDTDIEQSEGRL